MLSQVAIVVPTRNRPHFLHRFLSYHVKSEGLQIIFGDGSEPDKIEENKQVFAAFAGSGLDIVHYTPTLPSHIKPGLEGPWGYVERPVNGVKLSSRRYIQVCCDDDFVSPEFLVEAAEFLDAHPGFGAVAGYSCSFHLDRPGTAGKIEEITMAPTQPAMRTEGSALDRIGRFEFGPSLSMDVGFYRRDVYETIGAALLEAAALGQDPADMTPANITTYSQVYFYTVLSEHLALAQAKMHWLPRLQMGRHYHEHNWGGHIREVYKANLGDAFIASHWPGFAKIYLDAVSSALQESEGLEPAAARRSAEGALALRVGNRLTIVGQQRLGENGADASELRVLPSGIRGKLRSFRSLRSLARMIRQRRNPKPVSDIGQFPDITALKQFLNEYQESPFNEKYMGQAGFT